MGALALVLAVEELQLLVALPSPDLELALHLAESAELMANQVPPL